MINTYEWYLSGSSDVLIFFLYNHVSTTVFSNIFIFYCIRFYVIESAFLVKQGSHWFKDTCQTFTGRYISNLRAPTFIKFWYGTNCYSILCLLVGFATFIFVIDLFQEIWCMGSPETSSCSLFIPGHRTCSLFRFNSPQSWDTTWKGMFLCRLNINVFSLISILFFWCVRFSHTCWFQLWVGPGSRAAKEKHFFDTHLAPFYRIEQVLLKLILGYSYNMLILQLFV